MLFRTSVGDHLLKTSSLVIINDLSIVALRVEALSVISARWWRQSLCIAGGLVICGFFRRIQQGISSVLTEAFDCILHFPLGIGHLRLFSARTSQGLYFAVHVHLVLAQLA